MTDNYSGSDLECRAGRESYDLMQKAIDQGYTVRREPGRIIISIIPATTSNEPKGMAWMGQRSGQSQVPEASTDCSPAGRSGVGWQARRLRLKAGKEEKGVTEEQA